MTTEYTQLSNESTESVLHVETLFIISYSYHNKFISGNNTSYLHQSLTQIGVFSVHETCEFLPKKASICGLKTKILRS